MFHVKHLSESLATYKSLLEKYHKALDLLSDEALASVGDKIDDSLMYAQVLEHRTAVGKILDIGSGNGLPAIPMALALPHRHFYLVERRQRRVTFLRIVKSQLRLVNVHIYSETVEEVIGFEVSAVTAMAVGSLATLYCSSRHLHQDVITLVSRKGQHFKAEIAELEDTLNTKVSKVQTTPLKTNGTLVAVQLAGGKMCRS
ncbi:16S rRNA (guanine(527)-N(7))-methyltransferase RsmG [soil metagenome]